ncbi:uncharacterized protein F4822DRAFT_426206 [Hypoxylon trugodes]|uniref:uncharacterized protein n=1 Tax=Hypoxylon trugodes TaxID=326681 RepID=UPI002198C0E6|nr:uncharacterized protein F4822DRAFT_426206 [Hypoxylon trugodes]KAI1393011.1 hypothetical protein F4822DRAFT_426206 [Hypoxylon trugodes]
MDNASGVTHSETIYSKGISGDGVHFHTEEYNNEVPEKRMSIAWQDPIIAIALFIGSILVVVGHHIYYASLDNTPVYSDSQQIWAIRIGTGLALVIRCGLVATIGLAAVQQTWATLRQRAISIRGIDSMFDILDNPWSFLNADLLLNAKTLTIISAISWILPIITIVTPATLTVGPQMTQDVITTKVPGYNFSDVDGWPVYEGAGRYSGVGPEIARLFTTTYTSNSFVPQTPPYPNASYDLDFWGPSYKCLNLSEVVKTKNTPTWDTDTYNYTSLAAAFQGEIGPTRPANATSLGDQYIFKASAPGALYNMILIGTSGVNPLWDNSDKDVQMVCQLYNTSYSVTIQFDNGIQSIHEKSVDYLKSQDWDESRGTQSAFLANETCAPDPRAGNATICPTYYLTHYIFKSFLEGKVFENAVGEILQRSIDGETLTPAGSTALFQSGLADCPEIWNASSFLEVAQPTHSFQTSGRCRGTLATTIESLSRNFTYSLMTYRNWQNVATKMVPVTVSSPRNFFAYERATLLAAYLSGILVTLVCLCVGGVALWHNGYTSSTSFSAVLLTTRNLHLDQLAQGNTFGAKPVANSIKDTKLQFGILRTGESEVQAGFGFEGTVEPLRNEAQLRLRKKGSNDIQRI